MSETTEEEHKTNTEASKKEKHKTRYNGRIKKRKWEDYRSEGNLEKRANFNPEDRIKRKKCCLLLAYSGVNYFGMQRNPEMKTIEEELLIAMLKHKWITEDSFKQPQMALFQRAARTDKGVSAARQCVSMKLPDSVDLNAINDELPEDIRIFSVKRVTKGFNSKEQCDARTYTYTLPTIAFSDYHENVSMDTYRLSHEKLDEINAILKMFEGTKNFHNFTSRKNFADPSANRFIMSFTCSIPFVDQITNIEFVVIKVKGQSFMLHQIRKMIGLTLAVVRGLTKSETITRSFTSDRIDIPMAPGLGLVLDEIHYDRYNTRYGSDGMHETLEWKKEEEEITKFFKERIFPTIVKTEMTEKSMANWLETLSLHTYDVRLDNKVLPDESSGTKNDEDNGNAVIQDV